MTIDLGARGTRAIVLDIEGTVAPIAFVYDVLFPYARAHLRAYLEAHAAEPVPREAARLLREEHATDSADPTADPAPPPLAESLPRGNRGDAAMSLLPYLEWLMGRDSKSPGLKLLQGLIWEQGFAAGALRSELFPDVPPALARWRAAGIGIAIYSSGSVLAQRLIFAHSSAGDLTPLVDAWFDTAVGPKRASPSYRRIASSLGHAPSQLLFVSDVVAELDAAAEAGLATALCVRPGNPPQPPSQDVVIRSFDEIVG